MSKALSGMEKPTFKEGLHTKYFSRSGHSRWRGERSCCTSTQQTFSRCSTLNSASALIQYHQLQTAVGGATNQCILLNVETEAVNWLTHWLTGRSSCTQRSDFPSSQSTWKPHKVGWRLSHFINREGKHNKCFPGGAHLVFPTCLLEGGQAECAVIAR